MNETYNCGPGTLKSDDERESDDHKYETSRDRSQHTHYPECDEQSPRDIPDDEVRIHHLDEKWLLLGGVESSLDFFHKEFSRHKEEVSEVIEKG